MASGLPVVTTAMDGAGELIADGHSGFVLPDPDDIAALRGRMQALLDAGERRRLGAAARRAALQHGIVENCRAVEAVLVAAAAR
jgi:glycosyltransferase involved in cell wall biosynthesis